MLHRKTNRFTLILVYALLEWTLIILLLLNSVFSYLIIKFANYFGLKNPCLLCSRLDHLFEPNNNCKHSYKDLICDNHASEISQLGYCSSHGKLAESQDMCQECLYSSRGEYREEFSKKFAFFPWMNQIGMVQGDGEIDVECSCCGVKVDRKVSKPCVLVKPSSWGVLDCAGKGKESDGRDEILDRSGSELFTDRCVDDISIEEVSGGEMVADADGKCLAVREEDADEDNCSVCGDNDNSKSSACGQHVKKGGSVVKENDVSGDDAVVQVGYIDGKSLEIRPQDMEFLVDGADYRLIPVELIDASMVESESRYRCKEENEDFIMEFDLHDDTEDETTGKKVCNKEEKEPLISFQEIEKGYDAAEPKPTESRANECFSVLQVDGDSINVQGEQDLPSQVNGTPAENVEGAQATATEDAKLDTICNTPANYVEDAQAATIEAAEYDADRHIPSGVVEGAQAATIEDVEVDTDRHICASVVGGAQAATIEDAEFDADCHIPASDVGGAQAVTIEDAEVDADCHIRASVVGGAEAATTEDAGLDADCHIPATVVGGAQAAIEDAEIGADCHILASDVGGAQAVKIEDEEIDADRHITARDVGGAQAATLEDDKIIPDGLPPANNLDDAQTTAIEVEEMGSDSDDHQGTEEVSEMRSDEDDAEISIGTEIPEHIDEMQAQEIQHPCSQEELWTSVTSIQIGNTEGSKNAENGNTELKTLSVEISDRHIEPNLFLNFNRNEFEDGKTPDTPGSVDSVQHFYKKSLILERRDSGTEDSLDGSAISDIECGDGLMAIEKLKSALKTERNALNSLYAELEEERSASAVAASQTMAMINRLQEEKASMQIEALQYQRMMEEQSEYDQEALQLLNELMVKREREKQELEKELEIYRKKVQEYEAKEKMMISIRKDKSTRSRISSTCCSNGDDSDDLSVDLDDEEARDCDAFENNQENGNHKTPADAVLYLEESLANFEDERLSILEQLKGLEEKLFTLSDEEENFEYMKQVKHFLEVNGNGYEEHFDISEANGSGNGHIKGMNGNRPDRRNFISKAKRLLPLFDAAETEHGEINGNKQGCESVSTIKSSVTELDGQYKKLAVEDEVDYVYERLQALEADREFLKHCIGSLQKGDKGLYLLQEILQHLRDLKSVELRARSSGDGTL